MASIQNFASGTRSGSANTTLTVAITVGSGSKRKIVCGVASETSTALNALTFDGTSFLANLAKDQDIGGGAARSRQYYYDIPDNVGAGSYNVVLTFASSTSAYSAHVWQLAGVATGAAEATAGANNATGLSVSSGNLTATNGAVLTSLYLSAGPTANVSFTGDVTERTELAEANYTSASADAVVSGAGTKSATGTDVYSGTNRVITLVSWAAVNGPTIDTQPTATTVRVNGDTTNTATFTVAATTSGGSLTYDWELETSVGSGTYANLADGSGATWTGQASASCVGTFTAKTLSGRRVRCNVTDSNGTTTTDAVVLTVLDGPVLSASTATTNGSGVASVTMTSDDALSANGEILLVTATVRGQVVARTTVRPA